MFGSRRMTFQLTPLLDLLLIVIFAQYMEVQQSTDQQAADHQREMQLVSERHEAELAEVNRLQVELRQLIRQLEERSQLLQSDLDQSLKRNEQIADVLAELFRIPEELLEEAIANRQDSRQPLTDEEIQVLRKQFQKLAESQGREVVQHLMTYDEVRKHCDVWEVYVADNGVISLNTGRESFEFRAETREAFEDELFNRSRTLPEPKGLVIIIFGYGDARLGLLERVMDGMPGVAQRLQAASNGRTRFEYAILGYSPLGPSLDANQN